MNRKWLAGLGLASLLALPMGMQLNLSDDRAVMREAEAATTRRVDVTSRSRTISGRQVGEVLVDDEVVFRIRAAAGGYTASQRAQVVAERLSDLINRGGLSVDDIRQGTMNGERVLLAGDELLITADSFHAQVNRTTPVKLATSWERNLEYSLMSPEQRAARDRGNIGGRLGAAQREELRPELDTKLVPILSVGTGLRLGMAQVTGPERDVDQVKAVAEIETEYKRSVRARLYVPISNLNVTRGIDRVPRVGVSGLADVRLRF